MVVQILRRAALLRSPSVTNSVLVVGETSREPKWPLPLDLGQLAEDHVALVSALAFATSSRPRATAVPEPPVPGSE